KSPFAGLSLPSILVRQSSGEVAPLGEKVPSAPPALTAAIQKAMSVQPEQRYPTCQAFAQALLAAAAASSAPTAALVRGLVVAPPEQAKPVCPVCKKKIKVDPTLAGKRIRCSACSSSLLVAADLRSFQVLEPGANVGLRLECPACRQVIRFHPKLRGK